MSRFGDTVTSSKNMSTPGPFVTLAHFLFHGYMIVSHGMLNIIESTIYVMPKVSNTMLCSAYISELLRYKSFTNTEASK